MSELNEIASALAKAQTEMSNPKLDSMNPHFRSKFASLAAVRDAVVPILAKHGLFVAQNLTNTDDGVACTTIITHSSGQQMTFGPINMPATKRDAQGLGSAATYARRYALMATFCIVGDTDDDANAAVKSNGKDLGAITAQQAADLQALAEEVKANLPRFLTHMGYDTIAQIPAARFGEAVKKLEAKRVTQ